jgi:hypothetical protein
LTGSKGIKTEVCGECGGEFHVSRFHFLFYVEDRRIGLYNC